MQASLGHHRLSRAYRSSHGLISTRFGALASAATFSAEQQRVLRVALAGPGELPARPRVQPGWLELRPRWPSARATQSEWCGVAFTGGVVVAVAAATWADGAGDSTGSARGATILATGAVGLGSSGSSCFCRPRSDALQIRDKAKEPKTGDQNCQPEQKWENGRPSIFIPASHLCARRFRCGCILQIGIAIDGTVAGSFKRIEIRRHVDVEKFAVNQKEALGVSEAREIREIVRFDFGQARRSNLRQPARLRRA